MENYIEQGYSKQISRTSRESAFNLSDEAVTTKIDHKYQPKTGENQGLAALTEHFLFNEKNSELFSKLKPFLEKVSFAGNDSIYQPGDRIDYVYFPQSSVFSEFQILENGATIEIAMTGSEGIVGLASIFHKNQVANWTNISAAGNAYRIKSRILRNELSFNRSLQHFFYRCIGSYIKQISQRSVCNKCHSLEKRLCSWLLMMQDRLQNPQMPLTQEQMARTLGANRPSVTNIAYNLRGAKIINYRRGALVIRNRVELENRACECYTEIDGSRENNL